MGRRKKKAPKHCDYGGKVATTRDHVPPANLFYTKPSNLITVPSCRRCNEVASLDDQHFRQALALHFDTNDHPEMEGITETVMPSLQRPEGQGLLNSLFRSLTGVEFRTASGLYVRTAPGYAVHLPRLEKVATRTVKGLFYHESQSALGLKQIRRAKR